MGNTHVGSVHKGVYPVGGIHAGVGEMCDEEGATERSCDGLTSMPAPHRPCTSWCWVRREVEELGMKE